MTEPLNISEADVGKYFISEGMKLRMVAFVPESNGYPVWCASSKGEGWRFTADGRGVHDKSVVLTRYVEPPKALEYWYNVYGDLTCRSDTKETALEARRLDCLYTSHLVEVVADRITHKAGE